MTLPTKDLTQLIGTAVLAPKVELTSGAKAAALRELLEQRGILVFPRVEMQDEEQLAFARTLGEVINQGEKGIYKITLDKKITPSAEYLKGTILWHIDGWADDVPARGSILSARVLSPTGGQTEFSNTYAAYEELPAEKKAQIANLKVYHTMAGTQRDIYDHITRNRKPTGPAIRQNSTRWSGPTAPAANPCCWAPARTGWMAWTRKKAAPCWPS